MVISKRVHGPLLLLASVLLGVCMELNFIEGIMLNHMEPYRFRDWTQVDGNIRLGAYIVGVLASIPIWKSPLLQVRVGCFAVALIAMLSTNTLLYRFSVNGDPLRKTSMLDVLSSLGGGLAQIVFIGGSGWLLLRLWTWISPLLCHEINEDASLIKPHHGG